MVSDLRRVVDVEVLLLQDVLELVDALQSVVHVSRKVTVEEAHHVAVEGEADRHASFISLREDAQLSGEVDVAAMLMNVSRHKSSRTKVYRFIAC